MDTYTGLIKKLCNCTSIGELNETYDLLKLSTTKLFSEGFFEGVATYAEFISTINHITNYNIVRVADEIFESRASLGLAKVLTELITCCDSIKEHEDNNTEKMLISDLCRKIQQQYCD